MLASGLLSQHVCGYVYFCETALLLSLYLQEKSKQEIDLTFKLKAIQQSLEQEEADHKTTKARLADNNKINQSIEEAKSEALKGAKFCTILLKSALRCP